MGSFNLRYPPTLSDTSGRDMGIRVWIQSACRSNVVNNLDRIRHNLLNTQLIGQYFTEYGEQHYRKQPPGRYRGREESYVMKLEERLLDAIYRPYPDLNERGEIVNFTRDYRDRSCGGTNAVLIRQILLCALELCEPDLYKCHFLHKYAKSESTEVIEMPYYAIRVPLDQRRLIIRDELSRVVRAPESEDEIQPACPMANCSGCI